MRCAGFSVGMRIVAPPQTAPTISNQPTARVPPLLKNPIHSGMITRAPQEFVSRRERRQAAPETTFREVEYIDRLSKNRIPVVVKLIDGEEVRGWIEYYDKDIIRITRDAQPNLFIFKNRVKYLFEDPDVDRRSRNAV
jgi:host factor-I protein